MVAAELGFWAGVDGFVCDYRIFLRQGILDGMEKRDCFDCRLAFCPKSYFQLCVYAFAIWAEK